MQTIAQILETRLPTRREYLVEFFGAEAVADAESRHYPNPLRTSDGKCVLGILGKYRPPDRGDIANEASSNFPTQGSWTQVALYSTLWSIMANLWESNDIGRFTTPGSLTAYLDVEVNPI